VGASVVPYWPGITEAHLRFAPGFWNDDRAWGNWMAEREQHEDVLDAMRGLGVAALLTFKTEGVDDADVAWVTPDALERAADHLRALVLDEDPRTNRIVATYEVSANNLEPVRQELARDLQDVACVARFARQAGASVLTLEVGW
jgi:hypothetical protein